MPRNEELLSRDGDGGMVVADPLAVREALQWGYRDALREHGELLESLGISLREAAYRGDDVTARSHVMQARAVLLDAIDAVKELAKVSAKIPAVAA
jgi:3-deoxy-D-manno-octulosonate 8-phosphate phosphatase KdsC-like HAD superfamily phosphatase